MSEISGNLYSNFDPKLTVDYKVLDSSRQFFEKHKYPAIVCYVNPDDFNSLIGDYSLNTDNFKIVHGIRVIPDVMVSKNHFLLGEVENVRIE